MMNCVKAWPEPITRVQHLSDSGIRVIPDRYVKKPSDRPGYSAAAADGEAAVNIPVVDMAGLFSGDVDLRAKTAAMIDSACREWGFFQAVNHGVDEAVMERTREVWREFFRLGLEEKQRYANSPTTYEGYGSRLGVQKGASLDWSDYFFLNYLPVEQRDENKWPCPPVSCRYIINLIIFYFDFNVTIKLFDFRIYMLNPRW